MTDPTVGKKKSWSPKRKLLLFGVLPLALVLAILLMLDRAAHRRLNAVFREARLIGGPVSFGELLAARKSWPDEENGPIIFLELEDRLSELFRTREQFVALPGFDGRPILAVNDALPLGRRLPAGQDREAGQVLTRLTADLSQIDRLLGFQGGCFPLTIPTGPGGFYPQHLSHVHLSAKLKAAQAQYRVMHGDLSQAVKDVRVILMHGQLLADEPTLVSAATRIVCEELAVDTVQRICALATLTPEQLKELQDRLADTQCPDRLAWGIRGERAGFIQIADWHRLRNEIHWIHGDPGGLDPPPRWVGRIPGIRGLNVWDEAAGLHLYNRQVAAAGDRKRALQAHREVVAEMDKISKLHSLTLSIMPPLKQFFEQDGNLEAQIRAAVAGLAAERYRLDHGRFPDRLEDLVPQYLPQVLLDPFNDEPLRLRHCDGALMIYSVGADLIDDGGGLRGWMQKGPYPDWGFILLPPERRGLPATQPAAETQTGT
ncbi:MAG TPA: hypothetical protein PLI64_02380 [Phycisphaerae bacterium]|nr:hypothetical protein [Phycisphaerae bacterium]